MRQVLLILGPIIIFSILLSGGLQITDPQKVGPVSTFVSDLADPGGNAHNTLQIGTLTRGIAAPSIEPYGTPSVLPYLPPPASPAPPLCEGDNLAVSLLLDTSGSIGVILQSMKDSANRIASFLDDESVIGVQEFGRNARTVVVMEKYKNNKGSFAAEIARLGTSVTDNTYMREGFIKAQNEINFGQGEFPGYNWIMIFVSDGIPNDDSDPGIGPDISQEPKDLAAAINRSGVPIYTVGIFVGLNDSHIERNISNLTAYGGSMKVYAKSLMTSLALGGQAIESPDGSSLPNFIEGIIRSKCR